MKILQIPGYPSNTYSTIEKSLVDLTQYLCKRKSEVFCLTSDKKSRYLSYLNNNKVKIIEKNLSNPLNIIINICKVINLHKINLIHVHFSNIVYFSILASKICNIPIIVHRGSFQNKGKKVSRLHRLFDYLRIFMLNNSSKIISNSYEIKNELISLGVEKEKIIVIYRGINIDDFLALKNHPYKKKIKDNNNFIVGMVAGFRPEKNHMMFLKAAQKVLSENYNIIFLLVGQGSEKRKILREIRKRKLRKYFIILDYVSPIKPIMDLFDISVLTANSEPYGNCMIESMLLKKPVICTNSGGVIENIKEQFSGILVEPNDSEELAQVIISLYNSESKRLFLGKNAKEHVINNLNNKLFNKKVEAVYINTLRT